MLSPGRTYDSGKQKGYNTLRQALDDGAVVMAYGYVRLSLFARLAWGFRDGFFLAGAFCRVWEWGKVVEGVRGAWMWLIDA